MRTLDRLKQGYQRQQFLPSWWGIFVNPTFILRRGLYRVFQAEIPKLRGRILDYGCGRQPYRELFDVEEYVGLDIEVSGHDHSDSKVDVFFDGKSIPFPDASFDGVFASEVFEHVFELEETLEEIWRVMKPGGRLLASLPFVWDEHEMPFDFARYAGPGLRYQLEKCAFVDIRLRKTTGNVEAVFQLWNHYASNHLLPSNRLLRRGLTALLVAPVSAFGVMLGLILPKSDSCFLNYVVVARKPVG